MTKPISPEAAVTLLEGYGSNKPGYRRGHARGLALRGSFQAAPEARALTVAEHMQGAPIPCVIRVSNAAANPCAPDRNSDTEGRVLGLAVRFEMPSGAAASWAAVNIAAFPARTPEEFIAISAAQVPRKNGKPNMLKLAWHILRHLHILASVKSIKALKPSAGFAHETYRGIHTYYFVDAQGARKPFRYRWVPGLGPAFLAPEVAQKLPKLYLLDEIRARVAKGALAWDLVAEFPEAGDDLNDPSKPWPEDRRKVTLGRLQVERVHEDQKSADGLVFDPTNVVKGIELSDDPILKFRSLAYGVSYDRRSKEKRAEPAPADMGQ
jgi:catalase